MASWWTDLDFCAFHTLLFPRINQLLFEHLFSSLPQRSVLLCFPVFSIYSFMFVRFVWSIIRMFLILLLFIPSTSLLVCHTILETLRACYWNHDKSLDRSLVIRISRAAESPGRLVKTPAARSCPLIPDPVSGLRAWDLLSWVSWVVLILLVWGPHFEKQWLRSSHVSWECMVMFYCCLCRKGTVSALNLSRNYAKGCLCADLWSCGTKQ